MREQSKTNPPLNRFVCAGVRCAPSFSKRSPKAQPSRQEEDVVNKERNLRQKDNRRAVRQLNRSSGFCGERSSTRGQRTDVFVSARKPVNCPDPGKNGRSNKRFQTRTHAVHHCLSLGTRANGARSLLFGGIVS